MPKPRSLRAKMLALILLPVIVALAAVTLLAISRASSAQETSAYAELNQRTAVESAKVDAAVAGVQNIANSAALILSTSTSRADAIAGMTALQTAAKGSVVAIFGSLLPNTFGSDAAAAGQPGTLPDGSFQPSVALDAKGKIAVTASKDGLTGAGNFVKHPDAGRPGAGRARGHDVRDLPGAGPARRQGRRLRRHGQHARADRRQRSARCSSTSRGTRSPPRPRAC